MTDFSFTPISMEHIDMLHKWMHEPHVCQWWGEGKSWSLNDIKEKYIPYTLGYKIQQEQKKPISSFVIKLEDRPIGFIQFYNAFDFPREGFLVNDVWKDHKQSLAAIDFYIGEADCIGMGLGAKALQAFLKNQVFNQFDACLVDPDKNNKAAIKAYAKAGFFTFKNLDSSIIMIAKREETTPINMNKVFFIIGASGSGKTTLVKEIEKMMLPDFKTIYFDSIGVPSMSEMNDKYGGQEQWQRVNTVEWIKHIKREFLSDVNVVFDGQTRPSFIEEGCISIGITKYDVILLDCSDEERRQRLFDRGQKELADENMMNWAKYLRKESEQRGYHIIDNTKLTEQQTVDRLIDYLKT